MYLNVHGLLLTTDRTKTAMIRDTATDMNAWAIVLNETWLTTSILDAEVRIEGFNLYRSDRVGRDKASGGVCIYLKEAIAAVPILTHSNGTVESLVLKVRELELLLCTIYRPPDCLKAAKTHLFNDSLDLVSEAISFAQANSGKFSNILGLGDFNLPKIDWPEGLTPMGDGVETVQGRQLVNFSTPISALN